MPRFSIITITKNNPDGFAATRDSLKVQSFTDYEWIVIDGMIEADHGIYDAMNKGLDRANGQYVIFMNAGDMFATAHTLGRIAHENADFIYGDAAEDGHIKPARHDIATGMITHHQAMVYRRAVIGDLRYDTTYHIAADYKFTAQFLMRAQSRAHINAPLCIFETGGLSQVKTALGRREQAIIRKELKIKAPGTLFMQAASQILKRLLPRLYWLMRARIAGNPAGNAHIPPAPAAGNPAPRRAAAEHQA